MRTSGPEDVRERLTGFAPDLAGRVPPAGSGLVLTLTDAEFPVVIVFGPKRYVVTKTAAGALVLAEA